MLAWALGRLIAASSCCPCKYTHFIILLSERFLLSRHTSKVLLLQLLASCYSVQVCKKFRALSCCLLTAALAAVCLRIHRAAPEPARAPLTPFPLVAHQLHRPSSASISPVLRWNQMMAWHREKGEEEGSARHVVAFLP
ncbi:hypothetical protein C2845_PM12G04080 [Panicum miliaceum]|uniref:Secreted protein n=1 Tax=Panicum miliaceum TaxID=4540 RepID=A0A3L6QGS9_PANMI|nr:hypothetical protein C2845_PM12G04080 [Panicum miliaceum]